MVSKSGMASKSGGSLRAVVTRCTARFPITTTIPRCKTISNRPLFDTPSLTPANSTFGFITDTTNSPRAIRIALRMTF